MRAPAACSALAVLRLLPLAGAGVGWAEGARPTVVDVPSRPAFVQPPGSGERPVRVGESLLERGRLIAWIRPGTPRRQPLRFRTRSGTATILGTTVVLEVSPEQERIFSWEGNVGLRTAAGRECVLAAARAALRMQSAPEALNRRRKKESLASLWMGIALHVGEVMAGTRGCRSGWSPRRSAGP